MHVVPIDIPELGNRSYLIHDGHVAIVIDPSRRTKDVIDTAKKANVSIQAVFETHIHNDYVTGGYSMSQELSVPYYVSSHEFTQFKHEPINDAQTVTIGDLQISALPTPGHTHNHLGFLVTTKDATPAFFSGGSLLYGAVGRTDLMSKDDTLDLAKAQYRTAQFLRTRLDGTTELYPTHGFGSFCAATETECVSVSTLAQQAKTNPVFTSPNEAAFTEELIQGLDAYPVYYAYMGSLNAAGPGEPSLEPPARLTRAAVMSALHTGVAVVDMRGRTDYAAQHISGTYNIELGSDLATYVGWLIAWEVPLIVVAATPTEVGLAQEQLSLIGREITGGQITSRDLLFDTTAGSSYPTRTFKELANMLPDNDLVVLDVRRRSEWQRGHVANALHIPLHELSSRMSEVDADKTIWVHCASGFRAAIAASMLESAGKHPALINDRFTNAANAGLLAVENQPYVDDIAHGNAQLIDVRDRAEWKAGHAIPAMHVPLGMILEGDVSSLDKTKPMYLYCDSGERSGMAENFLRELGFDATNIGGLSDWVRAGGEHGQ